MVRTRRIWPLQRGHGSSCWWSMKTSLVEHMQGDMNNPQRPSLSVGYLTLRSAIIPRWAPVRLPRPRPFRPIGQRRADDPVTDGRHARVEGGYGHGIGPWNNWEHCTMVAEPAPDAC